MGLVPEPALITSFCKGTNGRFAFYAAATPTFRSDQRDVPLAGVVSEQVVYGRIRWKVPSHKRLEAYLASKVKAGSWLEMPRR